MKILIVGINGKMGKMIVECAQMLGETVVGGVDPNLGGSYPVFKTIGEVNVDFDVIIDFSRPEALDSIIAFCEKTGKPVVLSTTGYSDEQLGKIAELSEKVAVFKSANMSLAMNHIAAAVKALTAALAGYDIEIIEKHHNQKVDAPSGTAKLLLEAVESALPENPSVAYGRNGLCKRQKGEIGVHAIRGGTIVGEHTVLYAGDDELIEIKHTALSRKIFANGSTKAAAFLVGKPAGLYDMDDYLKEQEKN